MEVGEQSVTGGGKPRDSLFRRVFGNPVHAASELRSVLPAGLLERLDLTGLRAVPGSFVGPDLSQRHVDALFVTRWAGQDAYLYVLLEHQSTPDRMMAYRMLRYVMRIWDAHQEQYPDADWLPVVVPVVIYQGRRRWKASTQFADLFNVDRADLDLLASVVGAVPRFSYLLDDLSGADPRVLAARPLTVEARVGLGLLGLPSGFDDPVEALGPWLDSFAVILSHPGGRELLGAFSAYLGKISRTTDRRMDEFMATMEPEVAEAFVSTWDRVMSREHARGQAQGRAEGQARGRAEGQAELLVSQLTLRFGDLDERARRAVRTASSEQISVWSARLVQGTLTLEDLAT